MRRIALAALGIGVALAALAHCGGTTGNDATPSPADGSGMDATVEAGAQVEPLDASSDQSVYTNTFDVDIQYSDQGLPDVQAPSHGGGSEAGLGVPDCPPFIYVDGTGNSFPGGICDPAWCNSVSDAVPADWSDGGEVPAREGGVCATYPWLGSVANDRCLTSSYFGITNVTNTYDDLPPCNWAREAGAATQGPMIGASRYDLCMQLYNCFMRTRCFVYPGKQASGLGISSIPCLCLKPTDLGGSFSATTCVNEMGP